MNSARSSPGERGRSTLLWTDALPLASGALTLLATSWALFPHAAFAPQHFWAGFVPVGAIVMGSCAASGFYAGARLSGRRPAPLAALLIRAASPVTYLSTFLLSSHEPSGLAIHAVSLDPSGLHQAIVTGTPAYWLVVLSGLGFAVGAAAVTNLLNAPVHCGRCRKYLPRQVRRHGAWPTCDLDAAVLATRTLERPHVALLVRRAHTSRGTA